LCAFRRFAFRARTVAAAFVAFAAIDFPFLVNMFFVLAFRAFLPGAFFFLFG